MGARPPERGCFGMRIIEYHDFRTLLGPCFISFSLPLLIPGVVLTVVGSYGNENWFPLFGGWHVTGIVILCIAIILLVSGIVLKCCFRPIISADIEQHLTPTHSMITGSKNLGYEDDEVLVISSTGSKLNNKVSPDDPGKGHVVSTHEKRDKNVKNKDSKPILESGGGKTRTSDSRSNQHQHMQTNSTSQPTQTQQNSSNVTQHVLENNLDESRTGSRKGSSIKISEGGVVSETHGAEKGEVKTTVKTTVTTTTTLGPPGSTDGPPGSTDGPPGDGFSDAGETAIFVDGSKPKKKKRKKRTHSKQSLSKSLPLESEEELPSARTTEELPALRSVPLHLCSVSQDSERSSPPVTPVTQDRLPKPVLLHDGQNHHTDLHVHFRASPEVGESSVSFTDADQNNDITTNV